MKPSIVTLADGVITVKAGDVEAPPQAFRDMDSAARFVAVASFREGIYLLDRSCADRRHGNWFDVLAFADLVSEHQADLRATNGWRIRGSSGEYTAWARPTIDRDTGEVYDGVFNLTKGEPPANEAGYYRLESILRAKGLTPASLVPAEGLAAQVRAVRAPDVAGKPSWHGLYRQDEGWAPASAPHGPIAYASPEAARAGAVTVLEDLAEPEARPPGP